HRPVTAQDPSPSDFLAGPGTLHGLSQLLGRGDVLAVDGGDDVTGPQPRLRGGRGGVGPRNLHPFLRPAPPPGGWLPAPPPGFAPPGRPFAPGRRTALAGRGRSRPGPRCAPPAAGCAAPAAASRGPTRPRRLASGRSAPGPPDGRIAPRCPRRPPASGGPCA